MEFLKGELVSLINQLLPGFVSAWIFHGLTAHRPKESPFERIIQALIFTAVIQAIVYPLGRLLILIGGVWRALGVWDTGAAYVASFLVAVLLGLLFAALANTSKLHSRLPEFLTKRTSFPSEWFSAFNRDKRYVYLHLVGNRRIYGWPNEWPDNPTSGHFVLNRAEWILDTNERVPLSVTERMLIPAAEVVMVEFEKWPHECDHDPAEFQKGVEKLVSQQKGGSDEQKDFSADAAVCPRWRTGAILTQWFTASEHQSDNDRQE